MAEVVDISMDSDIAIVNGDLKLINSDQQHIEHILRAKPGHFYQFPTIGVGVIDFQHGNTNKAEIRRLIKQNLEADGYRVNKIEIEGGVDELLTSIDATRIR